MFEIKGNVNTAICYAKVVEDEAIEQIKRMCDYEFTRDSKVRIMPDVHAGKGCTIGTTMTIVDKAVPNIVGVDIGCGMLTVNLGKVDIDFAKLDEAAHFVPSGKNVWDGRKEKFDLQALRCYRSLKETKWLERSLGTLGGGNHFIEVDEGADGTKYLVIHTGSRNLGKQVAEFYQQLAIDLHCGKEEYFKQRDAIIAEYKAAGRRDEIQAELKKLAASQEKKEADMPEDLCYLYGTYLEDYLHDVEICQNFARRNREKIAEVLIERAGLGATVNGGAHAVADGACNGGAGTMAADGDTKMGAACKIAGLDAFHTIHNYIDTEEMILRKGAIAAHAGEKVLIPINMRDGSVLAIGKGNPDWNYSAPHGAGRIMSRHKAKEQLNLADYKKAMEGIYTTSVNEATLDEAPMAYKSLEDIIDVVRDSVDIIDIMKPIYNFKAN